MRKRTIFNWAFFGVLLVVLFALAPAGIYVVTGKRYFDSGQYDQAVVYYQQAIRSRPTFALAYVQLGDAYLQMGKYDEAENLYKKAKGLDDESGASCGLGRVYWKTGRSQEAEKEFKRAMHLDPNDSCAYSYAGRMYYDQGKYSEAIDALEREVKLAPNQAGYVFLGDSRVNKGHFKEAIEAYKQALEFNQNDAKAHSGLARAYAGVGDKEAALKHSRIAAALSKSPNG